jgi:hypothetical protein
MKLNFIVTSKEKYCSKFSIHFSPKNGIPQKDQIIAIDINKELIPGLVNKDVRYFEVDRVIIDASGSLMENEYNITYIIAHEVSISSILNDDQLELFKL